MLHLVRIDDTLHVYDDANAPTIKRKVKRALGRGLVVTQDGTRSWIQTSARTQAGASGSDVYTWHADGDRVLHDRYLVKIDPEGNRTETTLKPVWRQP